MLPPDETNANTTATSDETEKSLETGKKVIDLNKNIAAQDGKNPQQEEKKDAQKWRQEG